MNSTPLKTTVLLAVLFLAFACSKKEEETNLPNKISQVTVLPPKGMIHTIQKNDTLSGLASTYNSTVSWISEVNKLTDDKDLVIGRKLFIPTESTKKK